MFVADRAKTMSNIRRRSRICQRELFAKSHRNRSTNARPFLSGLIQIFTFIFTPILSNTMDK